MFALLNKLFGKTKNLEEIVLAINEIEKEVAEFDSENLKKETEVLKEELKNGKTLDDVLPRAFALVRESAKRTSGQRHFDVQLMGGIVLHSGGIAEMTTGEGKTLAATAPVYLNALSGNGVHVVTVNEYLAKRDTVWMGEIYHTLGLKVACLVHEGALMYDPSHTSRNYADLNAEQRGKEVNQRQSASSPRESALLDKERDATGSFRVQEEFLKPISRREAYLADVTYGTNHEFGFDYLRDNLVHRLEDKVQRGHHFAVIDEVDSILIDEARTPLIISVSDRESSNFYKLFAKVAERLKPEEDYAVDEKMKVVSITDEGINKVERMLGVKNIYSPENFRLVHYLEESLKARALFLKDKDYVVSAKGGSASGGKEEEIIIVDQFTGRLMLGRRYSGGLHQAIEAKEGVLVKEETQTYARISIQNYFRMYKKLAGMTGTAQTSAEEFHKVYNLDVVSIPPNKPLMRKNLDDVIYRSLEEKYKAIVNDIKERHGKGQPVLLGTPSIEKNEVISSLLKKAGVRHEVLNAKNNEREGAIIAQAGRVEAVTIATNIAGRGVDIILGGNPPEAEEARKVRELGGLHVIGTERHEARRIDNQLRGRAGRQGDPGSSQFFLSLEDDLLRIFAGERIQGLMETLKVPEDMPIQAGMLSRAVSQAQSKVEGFNFDARKHLLEYDDVLNAQRQDFYKKRDEFLGVISKEDLRDKLLALASDAGKKLVSQFFGAWEVSEDKSLAGLKELIWESRIVKSEEEALNLMEEIKDLGREAAEEKTNLFIETALEERVKEAVENPQIIYQLLGILDMLWMNHLENIDSLSESVRLRAYAQHDPIVEYRRESHRLYLELFENFSVWVFTNLFRALGAPPASMIAANRPASPELKNVGRNDPCPCGSGKKYKRCHGA